MIAHLFSIYDESVHAFHAPIMAVSEVVIRRSLLDLFTAENSRPLLERSNYVRYSGDFVLYHVGSFDTDSGAVTAVNPLYRVCSLSEFDLEP